MKVPKRFKIHEAASKTTRDDGLQTDVVQTVRSKGVDFLFAVDGTAMAFVPVVGTRDRLTEDLPRLESDEEFQERVLPPKAFQEATRGKNGIGMVRFLDHCTEAQAMDGKPWTRYENPESGTRPPFEAVVKAARDQPGQKVEIGIDAEALVRLARAVGSEDGKVRLTVHLGPEGSPDADNGVIKVEPVQPGGTGYLMAVIEQQR